MYYLNICEHHYLLYVIPFMIFSVFRYDIVIFKNSKEISIVPVYWIFNENNVSN